MRQQELITGRADDARYARTSKANSHASERSQLTRTLIARASAERNRAVLVCLVGALFIVVFAYSRALSVPIVNTQDEGALYFGAHDLLRNGTVHVNDSLGRGYGSDVVGNLFASYRPTGDAFYRAFPGSIALNASLMLVGGDRLYWLSNSLFAAIAIVAAFLITYNVCGSKVSSVFAALLLATSPAFLHWSTNYFNSGPVLAIELSAVACLAGPRPSRAALISAGILIGAAVFLRSVDIAYGLIFLGFAGWKAHQDRFAILSVVVPVVVFTASLALLQQLLYGSWHFQPQLAPTYPASLQSATSPAPGGAESYLLFLLGAQSSLSNVHIMGLAGNWAFHVRYFLGSHWAFPLLIPALTLAGIGSALDWKGVRTIAVITLGVFLLTVLIYGNQEANYYGYGQENVRSSFIRYSLLTYSLVAVLAGLSFDALRASLSRDTTKTRRYAIGLASGVVMSGAILMGLIEGTGVSHYGLARLNQYRDATKSEQSILASLTQGDARYSLILCGFTTSKLVDPFRFAGVVDYSQVPPETWDTQILPLVRAAAQERVVYLIATPKAVIDEALIRMLRAAGLQMEQRSLGFDNLYFIRT